MKIEERASICSHCLTDTTRSCHNNCTYYERYKAFIEQKAIDDKECESLVGLAVKEATQVLIDKACEWLNKRLYPTVKVQKGEDIDVIDRWQLIDEFRKAMTAKTNPTFERCLANVNPETRAEVRKNIDLANLLTWQDVKRIVNIADDIVSNYRESHGVIWDEQAYYKEVLNRFNNKKKNDTESN